MTLYPPSHYGGYQNGTLLAPILNSTLHRYRERGTMYTHFEPLESERWAVLENAESIAEVTVSTSGHCDLAPTTDHRLNSTERASVAAFMHLHCTHGKPCAGVCKKLRP